MKNISIKQLINDKGNPANNQIVATRTNDDGMIQSETFISYGYDICQYDRKTRNIYLTEKWDFSNTTRKHLFIFLREICNLSIYSRNDVLAMIGSGRFKVVEEIEK